MAMKRSGNHAKGVCLEDGTWTCSACGAESKDFEMFEDVGALEECLSKNSADAVLRGSPEEFQGFIKAAEAQKWISDMTTQYKKMSVAAECAGKSFQEYLKTALASGRM